MDSSMVNKLIPQMFEEMRSNLGKGAEEAHQGSQNSVITTQSLLRELEVLDKIIPMVENVNHSLQMAVPQHLDRIHEICKSTNAMLDSWINIQSQAGYIYTLMSSPTYLKHASDEIKEQGVSSEELVAAEVKKNDMLKEELKREQEKEELRKNAHLPVNKEPSFRHPSSSNAGVSKPNIRPGRARMRKTNIPSVTQRLTRPTASSTRKMFR